MTAKSHCPECGMPETNIGNMHRGGCPRRVRDIIAANARVEPKGDCPFCDAPKWHVCKHFVGYVRNGMGVACGRLGNSHAGPGTIPLPSGTVCVDTGVSVRAYRKTT